MLKYKLITSLLCFFICITNVYGIAFDKMVVFGDSISDIGNMYDLTLHHLPKSPPYYKGRFSNGPIWVEYLAASLKLPIEDYATGGASYAKHWGEKQLPYTLNEEIDAYLAYNFFSFDVSKTLFVIWAGGNDYLDAHDNIVANVTKSINMIDYNIQWLINARNAKYFVVLNLPNMGMLPISQLEYSTHKRQKLIEASHLHNVFLAHVIKKLQKKNPNTIIILFDTNALFNLMQKHPEKYKLKHMSEPCYQGEYDLTRYLQDKHLHPQKILGKRHKQPAKQEIKKVDNPIISSCQDYFFWDHVHPTTRTHHILAKAVCEKMKVAITDLDVACRVRKSPHASEFNS